MNIEGMYPEILFDNVQIVRADRQACPVCNHPTGDCSVENSAPKHIVGAGIFQSIDNTLTFTVEEDVYEEKQINPFYKTRILLARKGQKISLMKAKDLGLL